MLPSTTNTNRVLLRYTLCSTTSSSFDGLSTGDKIHITHPVIMTHTTQNITVHSKAEKNINAIIRIINDISIHFVLVFA